MLVRRCLEFGLLRTTFLSSGLSSCKCKTFLSSNKVSENTTQRSAVGSSALPSEPEHSHLCPTLCPYKEGRSQKESFSLSRLGAAAVVAIKEQLKAEVGADTDTQPSPIVTFIDDTLHPLRCQVKLKVMQQFTLSARRLKCLLVGWSVVW